MKQQLWIVNSSLLSIFIVVLSLTQLLHQEAPRLRMKKPIVSEPLKKKDAASLVNFESIYQNDIFGTFVAPMPPPILQPSQKNFTTPVPELRAPIIPQPPEQKRQEFVAPLNIALKGIIVSSDEMRNVAMIADETNKEGLYHVGEKIKDAQVIKIARNRVIFLRANGQQETFFLRKEDNKLDLATPEALKKTVKQIDSFTFDVDHQAFAKEIDSLGNFIERVPLVGMAFYEGAPVGIRVGKIGEQEIGSLLGLKQNDIIVAVNNLATAEPKNRLAIYDTLSSVRQGDSVNMQIRRAQSDLFYTYRFTRFDPASQFDFAAGSTPTAISDQGMSRLQERETNLRKFKKRHPNPVRQKTMMDVRKKLMDNLRTRTQRQRA